MKPAFPVLSSTPSGTETRTSKSVISLPPLVAGVFNVGLNRSHPGGLARTSSGTDGIVTAAEVGLQPHGHDKHQSLQRQYGTFVKMSVRHGGHRVRSCAFDPFPYALGVVFVCVRSVHSRSPWGSFGYAQSIPVRTG